MGKRPNGKKKPAVKDIPKIAKQFCILLKKRVVQNYGDEKFDEIVEENMVLMEAGCFGTCASHDGCDANIVMENALKSLGFKTGSSDYDNDVWTLAWDMARLANFNPNLIPDR